MFLFHDFPTFHHLPIATTYNNRPIHQLIMGLLKISSVVTLMFAVWIVLSTLIPTMYPMKWDLPNLDGYLKFSSYYNDYNTPGIIDAGLTNATIFLFTAHPDDESMFFTPAITELSKANYNNSIRLICLSNGGFDGIGKIRERELSKAGAILGLDSVKVLDYVDNINVFWDTQDIVATIETEVSASNGNNIILTFDKDGVSHHSNHISIFKAAQEFHAKTGVRTYTLKSWNILAKYSGMLLTNFELLMKLLNQCNYIEDMLKKWGVSSETDSVTIYSDLNNYFLNLSTMTWAHYSQIVWFRWLWIFGSKYMNSNELVELQ